MKSVILILFTSIQIIFHIGCMSSSQEYETKINISCLECAGMEVSLNKYDIFPTGPNEISQSMFDSLGRVKIELTQNDTLNLLLGIRNKNQIEWTFYTPLYLEPGADIDLTIENGLPKFEGDFKIINAYYAKINHTDNEILKYVNANLFKSISASSLQKQAYLDGLSGFGTELQTQITLDTSLSEYYRNLLIESSSAFEIKQRLHFDTQVAINESNNNGMSVVLDSTLSNAFKDLRLHDKYINDSDYIWYLRKRLLPIFADILNYRDEQQVSTGRYEYIKGAIERDTKLNDFRELLLALFVEHMSYDNLMDYDLEVKLISLFQKDYPHSKYLNGLNYILTTYDQLRSGRPSKDLDMYDINGKLFKLSSLMGNLVYIDVWATWCGPCVDELKYSERLSRKYSSHPDLKFLYVSIDQDTEKWKKFLMKNSRIKDIHGIQNLDFIPDSSIVTSLYKITGIPRYIIIDKSGNIVTTNAKRPSELLFDNYLDSLLSVGNGKPKSSI